MFDWLKNTFVNRDRYKTHSQAVVVACFFNPQNSAYRLLAFQKWYRSIRHLHHRIIECLIGPDAKSQLPESEYIQQVHADTLLWHKESLLNRAFAELPEKFRYVFWLDTDVLFTNPRWMVDGVRALQTSSIIQPFEYCVHLPKNHLAPDFDVDAYRHLCSSPSQRHPRLWRSFCANCCTDPAAADNTNYDIHGHVGFAWGARRDVLDACPLYDRALIGGADHIIAHAAARQPRHPCISKSFTDNLDDVTQWSSRFASCVPDGLGYVPGDLYHLWHGDIAKRQYLQRIRDFTGADFEKDQYGFYVVPARTTYVRSYYRQREVAPAYDEDYGGIDVDFALDMGYPLADIIDLFSQQSYYDDAPSPAPTPLLDVPVPDNPTWPDLPATVPEVNNLVAPADLPTDMGSTFS